MIQINPLQSYIDGGARAAIITPPSASLVFDLPGKAIWVKGVKLKGIDHTYTFSHDNYITLTNTPDQNNPESEDIKIGVNITTLKNAIDATYNIVTASSDGLAPAFSNGNKATTSANTTYHFLGLAGTTLKWYELPHRNIYVETTEVQSVSNTDPLKFAAGTGIEITWDSTNKKIVITNSSPDVNHNTHYTTSMYIGENNDTAANKAVASNPYLKIFDDAVRRSTLRFVAGTGITISSDANGNITITNSAPDVNHNTDRTGVKLGTISGTKKTDGTVILTNSAEGLTIAGGTNKFSIGDGTNYIEVPITPSFTVTDKSASILSSLTTLATIAGTDIKAKVEVDNKAVTLTTTSQTIATVAGVDITAKITNYNTDEYVRQVPKTDNTNRPLMMINGGTSTGELVNTSMFSTGIYANASTNIITAAGAILTSNYPLTFYGLGSGTYTQAIFYLTSSGFILETPRQTDSSTGTISPFYIRTRGGQAAPIYASGYNVPSKDNTYVLLAGGGTKLLSDFAMSDAYVKKVGDTMQVSSGTMLHALYATDVFGYNPAYGTYIGGHFGNSGSWYIYSGNATYSDGPCCDVNGTIRKIAHAGNITSSDATLTTSLQTIATIAGIDIKAKITNYNTDENVKQTDNNNNLNSPILLKNGTGTGQITSGTIFADGVTINPSNNSLTLAGYIGFDNDPAAFRMQVGADTAGSPLRGTTTPTVGGKWVGIFARPGKSTDEGGFLLSQEGSAIYNSFDSGFGFKVVDTDANLNNWNDTASIVFSVLSDNRVYSKGGFYKNGSSDSYILLGGGGHKALSDFAMADKYVKKSGDTMTGQLYINLDQDVGLNQNGSLVIGNKGGENLAFDGNEIMARNNSAASTLYLNAEGGNIILNSGGGSTGIGISPSYKLDVSGDIHGSHFYMGGYLHMPDSGGTWRSTVDRSGNSPIFGYGQGQAGYHVYYTGRTVSINAGTSWNSTANGIYINASNNIGIGNNSPSYKLHVSGDIGTSGNIIISHTTNATMTAASTNPKITFSESGYLSVHLTYTDYDSYRSPAGLKVVGGTDASPAWFETEGDMYARHYYESSDIRLKHDISSISQSIRKFKFNSDNKLYYGFIAQELETLHPELVDSSGEYKTVNYNSAICYYIAELENKVQKLEDEINKLKNK